MQTEYAIIYLEINLFSIILVYVIWLKTRGLSQMVAQRNFAMSIIAEMVFFATKSGSNGTLKELIDEADEKMYKDKSKRRS
ncbi:MAG: hypothetical protein K6G24_09190 [Lachnospiraceae bacterium]|nr:hypothetical protein [Lachnospiraceae bacterium]